MDVIWKLLLVIWMIVAACLLLAFRTFSIPSGSMIPTLRVGDYLVASKAPYGFSKYSLPFHPDLFEGRILGAPPKRGDVVVFALPRQPDIVYVKRVVGLPGETVQMKAGRLYINDAIVVREPIAKTRAEDMYGHVVEVPTYRETLPGGVAYPIIEIQGDAGFYDDTQPFRVPADAYFVLGDNRDNSTDSRMPPDKSGVGFVPFENLIGRADLVFMSIGGGETPAFPFRRIH